MDKINKLFLAMKIIELIMVMTYAGVEHSCSLSRFMKLHRHHLLSFSITGSLFFYTICWLMQFSLKLRNSWITNALWMAVECGLLIWDTKNNSFWVNKKHNKGRANDWYLIKTRMNVAFSLSLSLAVILFVDLILTLVFAFRKKLGPLRPWKEIKTNKNEEEPQQQKQPAAQK